MRSVTVTCGTQPAGGRFSDTYGKMYGMQKTTVYIPEDIKEALAILASQKGKSEAELIREALRLFVASTKPPRPKIPLFKGDQPHLAEGIDEALSGFGEA